ncbi:MAG: 16S rRNA (adenine(1518)-N(6)/adenine(1519)-N(6)) -dimethyltransferase [Leptospiraceae bacterium]|nr:MAG: 16S rRNA (adenine(1518)-N(6)/adenine(1519)-N(6)) -dimethyltransferase [Leptospiraceae bacterium]
MEYPFLSKNKIIETLKQHNANIRKSLGQNFLIDPNYIKKIVSYIKENIPEKSSILEIGPGLGAITFPLMPYYNLTLIEIDPVFYKILKDYLNPIIIYNMDILDYIDQFSLNEFSYVIGNLPYYITTDIIIKTLKTIKKPSICIFLVQKEYAEKLLEENNSISIYVHNFSRVSKCTNVPPNAFFPVPRVESMLIKIEVFEKPQSNPDILEKILRMSFRSKRKKILNSWQKGIELIPVSLLKEKANTISFDFTKRAEEISKELYYKLANLL